MISDTLAPHLVDWYVDIYTNIYGVDNTYTDIILQFNSYLKQMINGASFDAFSKTVMSIGIVLLLFYFFSDLAEKATINQLSMLQMGKSVGIAILALFVIFHTKQIFVFMLTFVEELNKSLTVQASGYGDVSAFLNNDIVQLLLSRCVSDHFSIFTILGYTLTALLMMLVSVIARVYVTYYSATRIIQLFVYYVFAPIGLADIFENSPNGSINRSSAGFHYIRTMLAIMLQIVVITITCQTFSLVSTQIHSGYFDDQGDSSLHLGIDFLDDLVLKGKMKNSAMYPLENFEYTDHKASIIEILQNGFNKVKKFVKDLWNKFKGFVGIGDGDSGGTAEEEEEETQEKLSDDEKYKLTEIVNLDGTIRDEGKAEEIREKSKYRMTVETTQTFFDWCSGSDGSKMILFMLLMITKVLMVASSAKLCNLITGVDV